MSMLSELKRPGLNHARAIMSALLIAGAMVSSVSLTIPAVAQSNSGIADYIPDTALFYGESELDPASDQFVLALELLERANLEALIEEGDLADFGTDVPEDFEDFVDGEAGFFLAELPIEEGVTLEEIFLEASDASMTPGIANSEVPDGWAIVLRPTNVDASFDFVMDEMFGDESATAIESEYNGYTILTVPPIDEFDTGASMAVVDDVIVVATMPEDIEPVIDTVEGDLDPLSGHEPYTDVRGRLEADVVLAGFVNGPALLEAFNDQDPGALAVSAPELVSSLSAHQGFAFWADDAGFRLDSVAVPADGDSVPEAAEFEAALASDVSADSLFYAGGVDLDQNQTLDALAIFAAQALLGIDPLAMATPVANPESYADDLFAETEALFGFNLKTDLLDQMVGEWGMAGTFSDVIGVEPVTDFIFVTELNDGETVEGVVATITNMIASQPDDTIELSSRQVDGSDVTTVTSSEGGFVLTVEFGVVNNQLLIGVNQGLDIFVSGGVEALTDDATFRDTLSELPSDFSSLIYLNVQLLLPLIEDAIDAFSFSTIPDNDPDCGNYATQEEAQAAYDEDQFTNFNLDNDFDGEACEDFFGTGATPLVESSGIGDVNVLSIGSVTFSDGETSGTNTIILIGE
ncbi:MAG: DUF3352 domain-containing protein [Thermomicrobiales bacterium]